MAERLDNRLSPAEDAALRAALKGAGLSVARHRDAARLAGRSLADALEADRLPSATWPPAASIDQSADDDLTAPPPHFARAIAAMDDGTLHIARHRVRGGGFDTPSLIPQNGGLEPALAAIRQHTAGLPDDQAEVLTHSQHNAHPHLQAMLDDEYAKRKRRGRDPDAHGMPLADINEEDGDHARTGLRSIERRNCAELVTALERDEVVYLSMLAAGDPRRDEPGLARARAAIESDAGGMSVVEILLGTDTRPRDYFEGLLYTALRGRSGGGQRGAARRRLRRGR